MVKITAFLVKNGSKTPFGTLKIEKKWQNDTIFRQILDFCHAKSAYSEIPNELLIECENEEFLKTITNGLETIFNDKSHKNDFTDFYKNRSIIANIKEIP